MARGGTAGMGLRGGAAGVDVDENAGQSFALTAAANVGIGIAHTSAEGKLHVLDSDTTSNATTNVLVLTHTRSNGVGAAGIGCGILLQNEDNAGSTENTAVLRAVLTTATFNNEIGAFRIGVVNASELPAEGAEQFQVAPTLITSISDDAATNTSTLVRRFRHRTSGTAAAGYGIGIALAGEDASGNDEDIAVLRAVLTTATHGSEVGAYRIGVLNTSMPAEGSEQFQLAPSLLTTIADTALTNTIQNVRTYRHRTSGTPAAGIGLSVTYATEDAGGADQDVAVARYSLTTATAGAEVGKFALAIVDTGSVPAAGSEQHVFTPTAYTFSGAGALTYRVDSSDNNALLKFDRGTSGHYCGFQMESAGTPFWSLQMRAGDNALHFYDEANGDVMKINTGTIASDANAVLERYQFNGNTVAITGSTSITRPTGYIRYEAPTYSDGSAVTIDAVATLYIQEAPVAAGAGPVTITNAYALWVDGGAARFDGNIDLSADGQNVIFGSTNGTKLGTATTQKLAFYNSTPIVQPSSTGEATGYTGAGGTALTHTDTFTGNSGTKAYTINDIVKHLKALGLVASS